jgi:hypothetical protein
MNLTTGNTGNIIFWIIVAYVTRHTVARYTLRFLAFIVTMGTIAGRALAPHVKPDDEDDAEEEEVDA